MSVTDGTLDFGAPAEETVRVVGSITTEPGAGTQTVSGTVTANQGTPAAVANSWPIKVSDGVDTADVALPGANIGAGLVVSTGAIVSTLTLNALSAVGPGVVVDFGSAKANISLVFLGTVADGTLVLDVSHDNSTWFQTGTPIAITTTPQNIAVSNNAFRYARARITEDVTAGTVTATLMAS